VVGGVRAMRKYEQLLGLPGVGVAGGCRVVSARVFADARIELELIGDGIERTTVSFSPPEAERAFASTPGFALFYKGSEAPPLLVGLLKRAVRRLQKFTLPALAKVILVDPEKRLEGTPSSQSESGPDGLRDSADMTKSLVQAYGSPDAWLNFFADREQQRNFCHNLTGSTLLVEHEDLECHWATPRNGDGSFSFFNYPSTHERNAPGRAARWAQRPESTKLLSDLHDLDVIKGGVQKLDRALDSILDWNDKPDTVVVRATCVPIVIGDDVEGSVERFKKKSGLNVIYMDNVTDQHATPFRLTFRRVKDDPEFERQPKIPGSVNLIGFPGGSEMEALVAFLAELGVTVNCALLPDVDVDVMRRYKAAEVAVLFDTVLYDKAFEEVIGDIDLPSIRPAAPFGVRQTREWLRAVASAVGRDQRFDDLWSERFAEPEQQWSALCARVAGYRLGFVVDEERAQLLTEPRRLMGIPIVAMLAEAGFGLDFLVHVPADSRRTADAILGSMPTPDSRVLPFSSPAELSGRLHDSTAQAFYSEVFFDRRLTRSGKGQFSCAHFRVGLEGAIAAVQQILAVCRMPFYRRYSRYLGEAFHA
jgi:hypothetical protein